MKKLLCCLPLLLLPVSASYASGLVDLYGKTVESDPRLNVSRENKAVGIARADQAFSRLLPQVSVSSSWTENERELLTSGDSDHYKGERYNLAVQQKLFDLSAWHDKKRYEYLSEEAAVQLVATELEVVSDLVARYLEVLAKQDAEELIVAEKNATKKQLELLKSRYERQLATITHVLEVEARYDAMLAEEIKARAEVEIALEGLSELVGEPVVGPLDKLADTIGELGDLGALQDWIDKTIRNNPNLLGRQRKVSAQEAGLRQSDAASYPTLGLTLSAQKSDIGFENSQSARTETYVATLTFSMPLYEGGMASARKAESRALLNIAQYEYEEARRGVLKSVRAAFLNTKASKARMKAAQHAVKSAEKSYEAQEKGFKLGAGTVVDVLDALQEQFRVKRDFRQAQYDYVSNWVQLLGLSGELSSVHIETIDSWRTSVDG